MDDVDGLKAPLRPPVFRHPPLPLFRPAFDRRYAAMQSSELEKNKAVVQRYVDEIQNAHSLDGIESIFAEDFVDHMASSGGLFLGGMEGLKRGYAAFLNAFPDLHVTVEDMIAEGDKVVAYKTLSGTHRGSHLGIPM
jgi:predicted SnoaL-like aldol condensation-catalyzing enzyme